MDRLTAAGGFDNGLGDAQVQQAVLRADQRLGLAAHDLPEVFHLVLERVIAHHASEEHTSELQSHHDLVCRLLLEKKKKLRK